MITAKQYGAMMRQQGVLWPVPAISKADLAQAGVSVFQVGSRDAGNVFVLVRKGWATVYVKPSYSGHRAAFDDVMPRSSMGRDVDHLWPKSKAAKGDYIALGRISQESNRSWNDDEDPNAMAQKVFNMPKSAPHGFMSQLTDYQRGWGAVSCFLRPFKELQNAKLTKITAADL